jgi:hypothetical protein
MYPLTRSTSRFRFFGGGYNPFSQLGPTLDLSFVDGATGVTDLSNPNGFTLNTDFTTPTYQIAAQYAVWVANVGLTQKNFADIVTFTRASTATYFNSAGTLTSAAVDEARFDYNPSTLAAQGLLIEEPRTNSIRNNTMVGAVAGTPGTLPTNWYTFTVLTGLTRQIVGTGTENGITYIDIRLSGTPSAAGSFSISPDLTNVTAAASGQTWISSYYLKLAAGSLTGVSSTAVSVEEYNSGGSFLTGTFTATAALTGAALPTQRYSATRTLNQATTAFVTTTTIVNLSGAAIDITLRIGLPQLEQGAFATSVIPTTTTALTRSADVASVNTLSPWFNSVAGTLYAESSVNYTIPATTFPLAASLNDNTVNNRIEVGYVTSGVSSFEVTTGGVAQAAMYPAIASQTRKTAGVYDANDFAISTNGSAPLTDTSGTVPTVTRLGIGSRISPSGSIYLRRITYYPRRLSNADLQTITT